MSFSKNTKNKISSKRFSNVVSYPTNRKNTYERNKFFLPVEFDKYNLTYTTKLLYRINRKSNYFSMNIQTTTGTFSDGTNTGGYSVDFGDGTTSQNTTNGTYNINKTYNWNDIPDSTRFDVTFSTGTNLVNKVNHGLVNGDKIYFSEIVTTTSLTLDYTYYVINATTDTFQLSKTLNGSAETINANGIGYVLPYKQVIISINVRAIRYDLGQAINHGISFWVYTPPSLGTYSYITSGLMEIYTTNLTSLNKDISLIISYPYLESIIYYNKFTFSNISKNFNGTLANCYSLKYIRYIDEPTKLYADANWPNYLFYNCNLIEYIPDIVYMGSSGSAGLDQFFGNCYNLIISPKLILSSDTTVISTNGMFQNCYSLKYVNKIETKNCTNLTNMFSGCRVLENIYELNLQSVTDISLISGLFANCSSLKEYGNLKCNGSGALSAIFSNCNNLIKVGNISLPNVTSLSNLFNTCYKLEEIGNIYLNNTNSTSGLFGSTLNHNSIKRIGKIYAPLSVNASNMFNGCNHLVKIESLTLGNLTNTSYMFYNCFLLSNIPSVNTSNCTNTSYMYYSCYSLDTIGDINISKSTNSTYMFGFCSSLTKIGNIIPNKTSNYTIDNMFNNCNSLKRIGNLDLSFATNTTQMFQTCQSLKSIGDLNINQTKLTNATSMFNGCNDLETIGLVNLNGITSAQGTLLANCYNLSNVGIYGCKYGHTIGPTKLEKEDLEAYFNSLGTGVVAGPGAFTISNNFGAIGSYAQFDKTGSVGAIGATTITLSNTSNVVVGSNIIAGPTTTRTITLTSGVNTVTINNHGIPAGKMVSVTATGSGLIANTPYYVVNVTTNTFGLSLTAGGTAITFNANTSATMRLYHKVTAVTTNTNYTIDTPLVAALATGTTVSFRTLDVTPILHRGGTVTG